MENTIVNILHLSDLHFGIKADIKHTEEYINRRRIALKKFISDFKNIPDDWIPDIVAITGDIGWAASKNDYSEFNNDLLIPLLSDIDKRNGSFTGLNGVILCAGNHDKNDGNCGSFVRPKSNENAVDDTLTPISIETRIPHFKILTNFLKSLKINNASYIPLNNGASSKGLKYLYGQRKILGIDFIVLNSCWDCLHNPEGNQTADRNSLRIGRELFYDALNQSDSNENNIIVTLVHHPFNWLHSSEIVPEEGSIKRSIEDKSSIILSGHVHSPYVDNIKPIHYVSSTLHSFDSINFECKIIQINLVKRSVSHGRYYYSQKQGVSDKNEWKWEVQELDAPIDIVAEYRKIKPTYDKVKKFIDEIEAKDSPCKQLIELLDTAKKYIQDAQLFIKKVTPEEKYSESELNEYIAKGEKIEASLAPYKLLLELLSLPVQEYALIPGLLNSILKELIKFKDKEQGIDKVKTKKLEPNIYGRMDANEPSL